MNKEGKKYINWTLVSGECTAALRAVATGTGILQTPVKLVGLNIIFAMTLFSTEHGLTLAVLVVNIRQSIVKTVSHFG